MKDAVTMADRSCWDQSFLDSGGESTLLSGGRCHSCADRFVDDVFDLPKNDSSSWLEELISADHSRAGFVRKSSSCSEGQFWMSSLNEDDDQRLNDCCRPTVLPPTIRCSSPSSGLDSGRASTSDDRIYQNGSAAAGDVLSSSTWLPETSGCSDLCPAPNDLILLDSGAFSESSSGSSSGLRTSSDAPIGSSGCASASQSTRISDEEAAAHSWMTSTAAGAAYSRIASFLPEWDAERLESAYRMLSTCGFYYGRMSMDEATERLSRWPVGTFLLRDSSDRRYLFSMSVKTCRGTTSIRMSYHSGLFQLDCRVDQEHLMPTFDCPLRLVAHYVRLCSGRTRGTEASGTSSNADDGVRRNRHSYVLLESSGRRDTPVLLIQPCRDRAPSLAHLCRRTIQRAVYRGGCGESGRDAAIDRLQLQPSLKHYLRQYPFEL